MASLPRKALSLKQLQRIWYAKLKKENFEDVEQDEDHLKQWSSYYKHRYTPNEFQTQQEYFQLAGQFLHHYKFKTKRDKKVWAYHAEGLTVTEVHKAVRFKNTSRSTVQNIILRLRKIMLLGLNND